MKTANLSKAKDDLSRLVEQVRRGERIRILVRGRPAAELVPVEAEGEGRSTQAEVEDLERRGIVRRGKGGWPSELDKPGPRVKGNRAVEMVLDERRRSR